MVGDECYTRNAMKVHATLSLRLHTRCDWKCGFNRTRPPTNRSKKSFIQIEKTTEATRIG